MISTLSFAAPWLGAAALLGIPALLAIHFLQLPARPEVVSTLFLLDNLAPQGAGGRRWQRLRSSVPLWLQLLSVLLIAWILAQPRWLRADAAQTYLLVLDSSQSMEAFRDRLQTHLPEQLRRLESKAHSTQWLVLETRPGAPRLYSGTDRAALLETIRQWRPRLGEHDFGPALRQAQALAHGRGSVILITDHEPPAPLPNVSLLLVGEPLGNVGFAGLTTSDTGWEVLVRNYGKEEATRRWQLEGGEWQSVTLPAGGMLTLRGPWLEAGRGRLRLDPADRFPADDTLPFLRPVPKPLRLALQGITPRQQPWVDAFLRSLPAVEPVDTAPDLTLFFYDPLLPGLPNGPALVFLEEPQAQTRRLGVGNIVAERDPLTAGLSWDGLLASEGLALPPGEGDRPLLWQGTRRLIFQRGEQLVFAIDPVHSNATRLPAFVVLLHRYVEEVRARLPRLETANVELSQRLALAPLHSPPEWTLHRDGVAQPEPLPILRAPDEPGFFEIRDRGERLFTGAAHFADPREADLSRATSSEADLHALAARQQERQSQDDPYTPLWLLLLGGLLILNWSWKTP